MKQKLICLLLAVCLVFTGCAGNGRRKYVSVKPHQEQKQNTQTEAAVAKNSLDLMRILEDMIQKGAENGIIYVPEYPEDTLNRGMKVAVDYAMNTFPLGAYVVDKIDYEIGTNVGLPAMALDISYRYNDAKIRQIRDIVSMEEARALVAEALKNCEDRLVLRVEMYFEKDFQQMVRTYAETYPEIVMEIPEVMADVYGTGPGRVVELRFGYQNGRDVLRLMHSQVKPVFDAAAMYVSGNAADSQKYAQLYAFLMERFDYKVETSITPAYSLLHHGVGDSRAFATIYASMCRQAGLECMVVTGTRSGEPWVWNIIQDNGAYQHVDLLRCSELGSFRKVGDRDMDGYVWDYSAYPECPVIWTYGPTATASDWESAPEETVTETTDVTWSDAAEGSAGEENKKS